MYVFLMFTVSSVTVIALNPQVVGQLLVVDCSSDVSDVSSTENQIVGQSLILHCRVVTTVRPIADVDMVTFIWSSGNVTLRTIGRLGLAQDYYVISQLNTSNEGQAYKCDVTISTIPPVTASDTIALDLIGKPCITSSYSCITYYPDRIPNAKLYCSTVCISRLMIVSREAKKK